LNWKYEAIDKLKTYTVHRQALESIPAELHRLELEAAALHSAIGEETPVKGGSGGREEALLNNIVLRAELDTAYDQAKFWVRIVDKGLAVLSEDQRRILDMMYINPLKGNVDRLCTDFGIEKTAIYRRRDDALRAFTIALYGITEH